MIEGGARYEWGGGLGRRQLICLGDLKAVETGISGEKEGVHLTSLKFIAISQDYTHKKSLLGGDGYIAQQAHRRRNLSSCFQ